MYGLTDDEIVVVELQRVLTGGLHDLLFVGSEGEGSGPGEVLGYDSSM